MPTNQWMDKQNMVWTHDGILLSPKKGGSSDTWDNMDKLKSGDIYEIADVVRNLSFKKKEKGLSTGENKMLTNAKQILVSELVLAKHSNEDEIEEMVDKKINNSFITFRTSDTIKQNVWRSKYVAGL